ncbi:MAG: hypothetical protein N3D85_07025 [Candidatus Bathyarchaeota archaeon]|nr:hypothetical protein [Candidatus Bathyarchaeota archaeon]
MGKQVKTDKNVSASVNANDETLNFLRRLVKSGVLELLPSFEKSGITYPAISPFLPDKDLITVKKMLSKLEEEDLLKSKVVDRVLLCPNCGSPEVHSKFACTRCNSENVALTQLIEHKKCGYIGALSDFSKPTGLICPRCGAIFDSNKWDYRVIGNFYQCENCGNRFDKPEVNHLCQNCGKVSTFQDIKYEKVFAYRVADAVVRDIGRELPLIENIRQFLIDKGFVVNLHSELIGASGVKSLFALTAEKNEKRLVVDVSLEGNKNDIVALLAKKVDVNPTRAILLDLSGGVELSTLGKIYGIDVISAKADQKTPAGFEEILTKIE